MEKVNQFLKENIAKIAICLGFTGIVSHILLAFYNDSLFFRTFNIVNFSDLFSFLIFTIQINKVSFLAILFLSMLITGGWHYIKSEGSDTRLLKFGFSVLLFKSIIGIFALPLDYLGLKQALSRFPDSSEEILSFTVLIVPFVKFIILIYISFYLVKWLISQQEVDSKGLVSSKEHIRNSYFLVSNWQRFAHWIFDFFLIYIILFPFFFLLINYLSGEFYFLRDFNLYNNRKAFYASMIMPIILYYVFFEGLFQATPIKFITDTKVVNVKNFEPPSFIRILGRTLSRRIPFEPLSFFAKPAWHDSLSGTSVVKLKREGQVKFNHNTWIIMLFISYVAMFSYSKINEKMDESRRNKMINVAQIYQYNSSLIHVNEGDLLIFKNKKTYRNTGDQNIVIVEKVSDLQISGIQYLVDKDIKINREKYLKNGKGSEWKEKGVVTLDKSQIFNAISNDNENIQLKLIDDEYALIDIVNFGTPKFTADFSFSSPKKGSFLTYMYTFNYDICKIDVLNIEKLEGNINWKESLPISVSYDANNATGSFELKMVDRNDVFSKSRMKIQCEGNVIDYIILKYGSELEIIQEKNE